MSSHVPMWTSAPPMKPIETGITETKTKRPIFHPPTTLITSTAAVPPRVPAAVVSFLPNMQPSALPSPATSASPPIGASRRPVKIKPVFQPGISVPSAAAAVLSVSLPVAAAAPPSSAVTTSAPIPRALSVPDVMDLTGSDDLPALETPVAAAPRPGFSLWQLDDSPPSTSSSLPSTPLQYNHHLGAFSNVPADSPSPQPYVPSYPPSPIASASSSMKAPLTITTSSSAYPMHPSALPSPTNGSPTMNRPLCPPPLLPFPSEKELYQFRKTLVNPPIVQRSVGRTHLVNEVNAFARRIRPLTEPEQRMAAIDLVLEIEHPLVLLLMTSSTLFLTNLPKWLGQYEHNGSKDKTKLEHLLSCITILPPLDGIIDHIGSSSILKDWLFSPPSRNTSAEARAAFVELRELLETFHPRLVSQKLVDSVLDEWRQFDVDRWIQKYTAYVTGAETFFGQSSRGLTNARIDESELEGHRQIHHVPAKLPPKAQQAHDTMDLGSPRAPTPTLVAATSSAQS